MKNGFALLETIIVITFISVSLLLLYGTFNNMITNSKRNILYDNSSNIYKAYYVKEYLNLDNLTNLLNGDIKEISCNDFNNNCTKLINELNINKMYIAKIDLKDYEEEKYHSSFNNYLSTLTNKSEFQYRLIIELIENDIYNYASIEINGDNNE